MNRYSTRHPAWGLLQCSEPDEEKNSLVPACFLEHQAGLHRDLLEDFLPETASGAPINKVSKGSSMERKLPSSRRSTSCAAICILTGGAAIVAGWYFAQRVSVPDDVLPVEDFDLERYLGHWYEIARIDYFFEQGLTSCTADYRLGTDGLLRVFNQGFDPEKGVWKSAKAVAQFIGSPTDGSLKVSFFRPFYSGYYVVHVDDDYQHAVVVGDGCRYCWVLSRTPEMDDKLYTGLLSVAAANGVDISRMHRVPHGALLDDGR